MEPEFKEGNKVLVSTLNFDHLKGPKKMRDPFLGPFTIIKLIGKDEVEPYSKTEEHNLSSRKKNPTPPEIGEVEGSPGPVNETIKARKIRMNCKHQRQYLVRFKSQTADKDKWLAEEGITDEKLHLRRFRASRRNEESYQ
ncbi:hypothetical protein O181_032693 [Austropuccinia psidii MF-1]|uniref:Chromo domain-containing protein n=1 Tax=Austropuccinia psidii MF-1 TaxID=1389203 RepID=A0A9Q3CZZ9_9BASI|nr:hypothetical protein [Austropuccinia psidii MF-1]